MNITNETLYKAILEVKAGQAELKAALAELREEFEEFKVLQQAFREELKTATAELRADIAKWGVILLVGSTIAMTSVIGIVAAIVLL